MPFLSVVAALEADADTLHASWKVVEPDPNDLRRSAVWRDTAESEQAFADEAERIREAMKPRHTHAAGWRE